MKPDVWVHAFIRKVLGRGLSDAEAVQVLTEAAHRVGRSARELDAGIWEHERGGPGTMRLLIDGEGRSRGIQSGKSKYLRRPYRSVAFYAVAAAVVP